MLGQMTNEEFCNAIVKFPSYFRAIRPLGAEFVTGYPVSRNGVAMKVKPCYPLELCSVEPNKTRYFSSYNEVLDIRLLGAGVKVTVHIIGSLGAHENLVRANRVQIPVKCTVSLKTGVFFPCLG